MGADPGAPDGTVRYTRVRMNRRPGCPTGNELPAGSPPDGRARPQIQLRVLWILLVPFLAIGCARQGEAPLYEAVPVTRRDLVVSVVASGQLEPVLTVDVKSKASGEITAMHVQTGDEVDAGELLANIDPRQPRNQLAQAEADLAVARAQFENAHSQLQRSEKLFAIEGIPETEFEAAKLADASAHAAVVRAEAELETARDQVDDTQVRAPLRGTILQKNVELGTVISSPTRDVGGGTVLFRMANLDTMQVRSLVDETDIGKLRTHMEAGITVDAYPNRPFHGRVLKIEPEATVQQNVTMFPVLITIANPGHLLMPGMNCEVDIHVGERDQVLAIPNAALRTPRDVASAASVLGLDPQQVQEELASQQPNRPRAVADTTATPSESTASPEQSQPGRPPEATAKGPRPGAGGSHGGPGDRGGSRGGAQSNDFGGSYIVFALRQGHAEPVRIATGLTDLDYIEVRHGLAEQDTVLVLPSASLVQAQRDFRERFQRVTGGGLPGMQQQQQRSTPQQRPQRRNGASGGR